MRADFHRGREYRKHQKHQQPPRQLLSYDEAFLELLPCIGMPRVSGGRQMPRFSLGLMQPLFMWRQFFEERDVGGLCYSSILLHPLFIWRNMFENKDAGGLGERQFRPQLLGPSPNFQTTTIRMQPLLATSYAICDEAAMHFSRFAPCSSCF
jgi:hypothetical protein